MTTKEKDGKTMTTEPEGVAPEAAPTPYIEHQDAGGNPVDWAPSTDGEPPERTVLFDPEKRTLLEFCKREEGKAPERITLAEIESDPVAFNHTVIASKVAEWSVLEARRRLPRGPLNQYFFLDGPESPPRYVSGETAPAYLEGLSNGFYDALATKNGRGLSGFEMLLSQFYATLVIGAGVCSNISSLTAGLATLCAFPHTLGHDVQTTILRVSHDFNHSFTLISYGKSPWMVADPWVAEPRIVPLEQSYFEGKDILSFDKIVVHRRLETPFGIPMMAQWNSSTAEPFAHLDGPQVTGLHLTPEHVRLAHESYEASRLPDLEGNMLPEDGTPVLTRDRKGRWGPEPRAWRKMPSSMRFIKGKFSLSSGVYSESTTHADPKYQDYWTDTSPLDRPTALVNEWGETVPGHEELLRSRPGVPRPEETRSA